MPAYYLFDVQEVTDPQAMGEYRRRVLETVERHGGRYLAVGGEVTVVEGDWRPAFPVLIEFPDIGAARAWYDSPEYRRIVDLRRRSTRGHAVLIDAAPFGTG